MAKIAHSIGACPSGDFQMNTAKAMNAIKCTQAKDAPIILTIHSHPTGNRKKVLA
jgi:hypothetical protein